MTQFDAYRESYRADLEEVLPIGGKDMDRFTEAKARHLLGIAERELGGAAGLDVLDVGCGGGETDRFLDGRFASLSGTDVSQGLLEVAREVNPAVDYRAGDGERLPYDDDSFHLSFCINVVHHVPPPDWARFVAEMGRVTRPGGLVAVFEHNPLNPMTRRIVSQCRFDDDAVLLTRRTATGLLREGGLGPVAGGYVLFLPVRAGWTTALDRSLRWLPLGAQYFVAGRAH
jgi:SAM-dependent methyltransferase